MTTPLTETEFYAALRSDFYTFTRRCFEELNPGIEFMPAPHIEAMTAKLQDSYDGRCKRLIIAVPPRHLKSICASIALPAFWLGHNPAARIICVSYGQDLAEKLARDCHTIMTSDWYQKAFATRLELERAHELVTTAQGYRLAGSIGGAVTGRGADLIVLDDPHKPDEMFSESQRQRVIDYVAGTLYSRLDSKNEGRIIVVMQRLHMADLAGYLLEQGGWDQLSLPAIAEENACYPLATPFGTKLWERNAGDVLDPRRESRDVLDKIKQQIGSYNFAAQYQQSPQPWGGAIVKTHWLRYYEQRDLPEAFDGVTQSWDSANKGADLNDYSVCTTWGRYDRHIYLLNVFRKRLEYPDLKRAVIEQDQLFAPTTILIEDRASGTQLLQEAKYEGFLWRAEAVAPERDKISRLNGTTALIENGFVHFPRDAPWLSAYIEELIAFPGGKYDDQVDSTSQALGYMKNNRSGLEIYRALARDD
jgi:predicted phage terminase large subunit-like protein